MTDGSKEDFQLRHANLSGGTGARASVWLDPGCISAKTEVAVGALYRMDGESRARR